MKQEDIDRLLREIQEHYGEDTDLASRYRDYARVDAEKALRQMQERLHPVAKRIPLWRRYRLAVAAVIAAMIVGGLFWHWHTRVVPPVISEEVKTAMARCEQSGRQEAGIERIDLEVATEAKKPAVVRVRPVQKATDAKQELLQARRVTTRQDKEFWLTLPDGTVAHLNNNTRIVYPEKFSGDTRDIYLSGEAYLMVAHDVRHPFIVHTNEGDVKVHGTEFIVNTHDSGERTKVVLVSGKVSVTMRDGETVDMEPGDMALLYKDARKPVMSQVDTEPYVAWNTGKFAFDDCPLEKLMNVLGHWYGYQVQFDSEDTRQLTFTGDLDRYSSVEPALKAISWTMGLRIEMNNGNILISKH